MNEEILKMEIKKAARAAVKNAARVIARHNNWVSGATITESIIDDSGNRRFTATIQGWRNFLIYEGRPGDDVSARVQTKVREIRDRIKAGDEKVFNEDTRIIG
jgi:hypothetical protein